MAWFDLFIAGIFEVVWSTCLKYSHGFTNVMFTVLTFIGMGFSFWFLAHAVKSLPMGTAYAIWMRGRLLRIRTMRPRIRMRMCPLPSAFSMRIR